MNVGQSFARLFLFFAIALFPTIGKTQICTKSQLPANLQNGLVAFYPFCGNANDASGNGFNGTVNGATLTTDRFGTLNAAYTFNGSSNSITVNGNTLFASSTMTISTWVSFNQFYFNGLQYLVLGNSSNTAWACGYRASTNANNFRKNQGCGTIKDHDYAFNYSLNTWYHVVYVISPSTVSLYINGNFISSQASDPFQAGCSSYQLNFGLDVFSTSEYLNGKLDDTYIFNRALSACEVTQLYNSNFSTGAGSVSAVSQLCTTTSLQSGLRTGLLSYYPMCAGLTDAAGGSSLSTSNTPLTSGPYGYTNSAYSFNGTNSEMTIPYQNWYGSLTDNFTFSFWVKNNLVSGHAGAHILWRSNGNFAVGVNGDNTINFVRQGQAVLATSTTALPNAWTHVVMVKSGSSNKIYLNGVLNVDANNATLLNNTVNDPMIIGRASPGGNGGAYRLNGSLSQMMFYGRVLSATEISSLYETEWITLCAGQTGTLTSPIAGGAWSSSDPTVASINAASGLVTSISPGTVTMTYTVTDGSGCLTTSTRLLYVTAGASAGAASSSPTVCVDKPITPITHSTTGATGIGSANGLPAGVSASWTSNTITISGTPTASGVFNYSIPLTGGCAAVDATGTITVAAAISLNVFSDTTSVCGTFKVLDAGAGFASYQWNTGETTPTINATSGGFYKVTVTNAVGCSASDSTFLSLVNANIVNNDITICKGSSITLSIDSLFPGRTACTALGLPANLRNGLVGYWPFCGNANDESGNGNNGSVFGSPALTADRFNNSASSYRFFGNLNDYISASTFNLISGDQARTFAFWFRIPNSSDGGFAVSYGAELFSGAGCNQGFHLEVNQSLSADCNFLGLGFGVNCIQRRRPISLNDDRWHLFTLTYSGAGGIGGVKMYVDGVLITSSPCDQSGTSVFNTVPGTFGLTFGRRHDAPLYPSASLIVFDGYLDDIYAYNRELSSSEVQSLFGLNFSVAWSPSGATTNSITVSPTQTTTYYVTVSDGITTCIDSVKVTVSDLAGFNPLSDTTSVCGTSKVLDAGAGFASYQWNTGETTPTINATSRGFYKVTVTNGAGCSASDSTLLSLVNANIINNDTTICKGSSITLSLDSLLFGRIPCNPQLLPTSLRSGLLGYWPFCGNANDQSGNGYNGTANGATLTFDKFGNPNSAYEMYTQTGGGNISLTGLALPADRFTIFANVNLKQGNVDNVSSILSRYTSSGYEFNIELPPLGARGLMGILGWEGDVNNSLYSGVVPPTNQFTSLVWNKELSNSKLFINNNQIYQTSTANPVSSNPNTSVFFGRAQWGGNPFKGTIDDIIIWNRALTNTEINYLSRNLSVTWSPGGATTNSITVSPTQTTTYYVTVSDGITTCVDSVKVTVSTVDTALTLLDSPQLCATGGTVRFQAGSASSYQWLLNGAAIPGATQQTYNATTSGTYSVALVNALGCRDTSRTVTITVNPNPTVNAVNNQTVCNAANFGGLTYSGSVAGTVYNWTNSNTSIGLANSGTGNLPTFTAINTGTAPVTATITVTPSYTNGGLTCTGTPITFAITVNPTPTVSAVNNQVLCNGANTNPITFSGAEVGTVYNWTNSNTSIGLAASGTGNIASFAAVNTGTSPITAIITVTPSYTNGGVTCTGTSQIFTITVNPTPTVTAISNQVVCNGANTTAVAFSGAVTGTVYNWTNSNTSIGLATSGTGNIASFAAVNTGTSTVTATITVTPSFTNGGVTCTGTSQIFTITVNPTPTVSAVNNQALCNGANTTAVTFSGAVTGTVYNWTNTTTSIGLAASGTGNIASFAGVNTGTTPVTATITVTPSYTNAGVTCSGTSQTFTITVNPTPTVSAVNNQVLCNGANTTAVAFSGAVTGTVYNWTNNGTSIGLAASGTGDIASFAAINTGTAPVTAIIIVTPSYTNGGVTCTGSASTFTITVNPSARMNSVSNQSVCNGGTTTAINFGTTNTAGTTTYSWTNSTPSIGLAASGTGNIASFIATNTTSNPVTATISVTPSYTNNGVTCIGSATTFTITVNPTPAATIANPGTSTICQGSSVTLTATGGTTYEWYLNGNLIPGASGSTYAATQPGVYTVIPISAFSCRGPFSNAITLGLITAPTANFSFDGYCAGFVTNFTNLSTVSGSGVVGYNWSFGNGQTSTLVNPSVTYTQPGGYNVTLTVTPLACPVLAASITKTINVVAKPTNVRYPIVYAKVNRNQPLQARTITLATYLWSPSVGLSAANISNPLFNYDRQQEYTIRIGTPEGCIIIDTQKVLIFNQCDIFVPQAFSPNGDGNNDRLTPKEVCISQLIYFRVYDRWGQLMFESRTTGQGWDGTYKGVKQPLETYAWIVEGLDADGNRVKRSGTSVLLR